MNCRKSRVALDELTKIRPRDDILFVKEVPLTDGQPPNLTRYTPIHHENAPRMCAYIKDASMKYMVEHEAHPCLVRITLTDERTMGGIYIPPGDDLPEYAQTPMKEGETRLGDFNAAHPEFYDRGQKTAWGTKLFEWQTNNNCEEKGPDYPTHDKGNKLDLIFCKDTIDHMTKIMHNSTIEHSDHTCQSIMIPLRIRPDLLRQTQIRANYQKVNIPELREKIEGMKLTSP